MEFETKVVKALDLLADCIVALMKGKTDHCYTPIHDAGELIGELKQELEVKHD
jgi:GTP1/Obg family GTP-binding protein